MVRTIQDARDEVEKCWFEHSHRFASSIDVTPEVLHWPYGHMFYIGKHRAMLVDYRFGRCRLEQSVAKNDQPAVEETFTLDRLDWNKVMPPVVDSVRKLKDILQFK